MSRLLLVALVALLAPSALAQTCTTSWTNPAGGAWETPTNWSNGAPGTGSVACITLAGTYTVAQSAADRTIAGLVVGGASGTQTLTTFNRFSVTGNSVVRSSGRWELLNRTPGGADGFLTTGTATIEGVFVQNGGTTLLDGGGTLDIAPGGQWLMRDQASAGITSRPGTFRLRGILDAAYTSTQSVEVPLDVQGGTVRVSQGRLDVRGGVLANATVDAAAGATLLLISSAAAPFTVSGTVSGAPAGEVFFNGGTFAATSGEVTLGVGGAGLLLGGSVFLTSAGGSFRNTGLLTHAPTGSNFASLDGTTLRNAGQFVMPGTGFGFRNGAVVRNEASGTIRISNQGGLGGVGGSAGRVENAGLLVANGSPPGPGSGATAGTINVPYDGLAGSTIRTQTGRLDLNAGGSFRDAAFDVPAGTVLRIAGGAPYTVSGTLSGTPAGDLVVSGAPLAAGSGGAVLALGGTGLALGAGLRSTGGSFVNTGVLVWDGGTSATAVVVENRGTVRLVSRVPLLQGAVLRNVAGATAELYAFMEGDGRFENAGLVVTGGTGFSASFGGRLRSLPGSEIRALRGGPRLDLDTPASRSLPDGTTLTGTGRVLLQADLEVEGAVSPGTADRPLAGLSFFSAFRLSLVAGSPRVVVDVDAGGQSDTLAAGGSARLAGALVVRVRPGYSPAVGDQWTVLTAASGITGQFSQVVAQGAPSGIAFVSEVAAGGTALVLRAVAVAAGGAVTVSTTRPVSGGVRPIFLSGPGAAGVSAARLECTSCLDPAAYGTIPAILVGADGLKEARFDLTSPRAFGLYDLVMTRPGLADARVPIVVRPYVSYVQTFPTITRGIGVRPASTGLYNWSAYDVTNTTNTPEPAYSFIVAGREDRAQVDFALASGNAFVPGVETFYESRTAADPQASALAFARIPSGDRVPLSYGLSTDPSNILFPEQTPTGPSDPRLPFGESRVFSTFAVQHTSYARAVGIVVATLRNTPALTAYLGQVDAADAGAVRAAVGQALESQPRYAGGTRALLERALAGMNATVATPAGLAGQAAADFAAVLDRAAFRHYADVEYALHLDLAGAAPAVQALLADEYGALAAARENQQSRDVFGNICRAATNAAASAPPRAPAVTSVANTVQCAVQTQAPPPRPPMINLAPIFNAAGPLANLANTAASNIRSSIASGGGSGGGAPFGPGGSCSPGGGGGAGGGAGGAGSCTPPSAPADPNDKTAETTLRCQFGTVVVGGQAQTRCVRYFVPLAESQAPVRYTIQFENLPQATAPAEFVTVTDTLDAQFDPASLRVLATSSDSTFTYSAAGQIVTFRFTGINLPPNVTAPEGQGFITYEVSPRPTVADGSVLRNRASIVFDFNPAIATPEVVHEVRQTADISAVIDAPDFVVVGQPQTFSVIVANTQGDAAGAATVTIQTGGLPGVQVATSGGTCSGTAPIVCTFGTLTGNAFERVTVTAPSAPVGQYPITATATTTAFDGFAANDSDAATLVVATVAGEGTSDLPRELTLAAPWPNPARSEATLRWGLPAAAAVDVRVYDLLGREVARIADEVQEAGWHEARWDAQVASGVYVVRVRVGADVRTRRMTVVR